MMRRLALIALAPALVAGPALAQHDHHAGHAAPAAEAAPDPHAGHQMTMPPEPAPPAGAHAHHHHETAPAAAQTTPPPVPDDHAADRIFGASDMARARAQLRAEHGAMRYSKVLIDTLELRPGRGANVFAWEAEASFGGDINRLMLKTEGEATSDRTEHAEAQILYSRAIDPYFNLQAGVRQDFEPRPRRTYAVLGIEGLSPYWIEMEAAAFLSDRGEVSARLKGSMDFRVTQKLILQPSLEADLSAEDVPERGIGSGLTSAEIGLRLRYEIKPEFAPYVGVLHSRSFGETADLARAEGEDVRDTRVVVGVRAWF